jgi:hypothetical protein
MRTSRTASDTQTQKIAGVLAVACKLSGCTRSTYVTESLPEQRANYKLHDPTYPAQWYTVGL